MRKKWGLLSFALSLAVILDVTPGQSQPEQGGKGKGGKGAKGERNFTFGQPPGGSGDGGGKGSDRGPGGPGGGKGGEAFGGGKSGDRGGPGGQNGGRGGPQIDPETSWTLLVKVSQGTNTIKFDQIPVDTRDWMRREAERKGALPLPETGEWNKEQFMAHVAASAQSMQMTQGGSLNGQGNGWGQGGDADPRAVARGGKDREKKDPEDERPIAIRFGKLPKDAPAMFTEMDSDKDGQICLYEWRTAGSSVLAFQEMDLNGDGLLTVEEYGRYTAMKTDRERAVAYENGETPAPKAGTAGRGAPGMTGRGPGSGMMGSFGPGATQADKSKDTSAKDEKRSAKDGGGPGSRGGWGGGDPGSGGQTRKK